MSIVSAGRASYVLAMGSGDDWQYVVSVSLEVCVEFQLAWTSFEMSPVRTNSSCSMYGQAV